VAGASAGSIAGCRPSAEPELAEVPAAPLVTLRELWRLAGEFDRASREVGELYSAAEFISWIKPELAGLEG
jgi:hypothetical protein